MQADGTPERTPLSPSRIIAVAVGLADRDGLAATSMRKIAGELGVEAMSLYHHVRDKATMLDGMVDQVMAEVALPRPGRPWRAEMDRRARSMRDAIGRHPWILPLLDSRPLPGPATLTHHEAVIATLRADGFSLRDAAHAFSLLDAYVFGFSLQEQNVPFDDTESDIAAVAGGLVEAMDPRQYPNLVEMATDVVLQPGYSLAAEFDVGLEIVLDGLARTLGPAAPPIGRTRGAGRVDR